MKTATSKGYAENGDATFALYEQNKETGVWEKVDGPKAIVKATETTPSYSYLGKPGYSYALVETDFNHDKYIGMDTIEGAGNTTSSAASADKTTLPALPNGTIALEDGQTAYYFDVTGFVRYDIDVYNRPYVDLAVLKFDAGGYPENVRPKAKFNIYEVPSDFTDSAASVEAFLATVPAPVPVNGDTELETSDNTTNNGTTYVYGEADPSKTYLVVEVSTSAKSNHTYEGVRKDDNRVVWYGLAKDLNSVQPGTNGVGGLVTLKNVYGDAVPKITKKKTWRDKTHCKNGNRL